MTHPRIGAKPGPRAPKNSKAGGSERVPHTPDMDAFGIFLLALAMLAGLVGTALPLIPGLPVVWGAALVYGLAAGFGATGTIAFTIITLLAIAGIVAGLVLPHRRVAAGGAPRSTVAAGVLGAVVGFFVIPVIGLVVGGIAGIWLAEYRRTSDGAAARKSTKDMIVGFGIGILAELAAGVAMVLAWAAWVLLD